MDRQPPELDEAKADTYIYLKADQTALVPLNPPLPTWQDKPGPWHAFVLVKPTILRLAGD